jgi:anti-sigma regulatory factor (Ser/Thr protein kinase)
MSVGAARTFATQARGDAVTDHAALEDVRLMVSELATNAVQDVMSSFHLTVHHTAREIRVEVTDYGSGTPAMRAAGPDALDGRGLRIVDMLSTRWGVEADGRPGKMVWFCLALSSRREARIAATAVEQLATSPG